LGTSESKAFGGPLKHIETVLQNMNKYDPFATQKSDFFWGAKVHLLAHEG
jgi:hypothetical protein